MDSSTAIDKVDASDGHNRNMKKQSISNGAGGGGGGGDGAGAIMAEGDGAYGCDSSGGADYTKFMTESSTKLTLASTLLLDDLQGDSSLEPGEVKTPPHTANASANATSAITGIGNAHAYDEPHPLKQIHRGVEVLRKKSSKSLSSTKTAAASTATETAQQAADGNASGKNKTGEEVGASLDSNSHKMESVKPKKFAEDAKTAIASNALDDGAKAQTANADDSESEGLYSSSNESSPGHQEKDGTLSASIAKSPTRQYSGDALTMPPMSGGAGGSGPNGPAHMMPPYQDAYMGYRHQFGRGNRPDFHHGGGRGGFMPRMRGNPRFPGYRPPFFSNGPPRHHMSNPRHHTPPPSRGHSPVKAPNIHLFWTKTKPSISYAFNDKNREKSSANKSMEHIPTKHEKTSKSRGDEKSRRSHKQQHSKPTKAHEHDKKRKRRSSRSSSEKSYKRNIEKIRESMKRRTEKVKPQPTTSDDDKLAKRKCLPQENVISGTTTPPPPVEQDIWIIAKKIKVEKIDADEQRESTPCLELLKEKIKVEIEAVAEAELDAAKLADTKQQLASANDGKDVADKDKETNDRDFDMFAESPPRAKRKSSAAATKEHETEKQSLKQTMETQPLPQQQQQSTRTNESEERMKCETASNVALSQQKPTLPTDEKKTAEEAAAVAASKKMSRKTALQQAIETQKRIGELLQDDDLDMEAIEATKKKLLQSTNKSVKVAPPLSKPLATEPEKVRKDDGVAAGGATGGGSVAPVAHDVHKHRNPFKRSVSRDRFHNSHTESKHRSRTNSRDREERGRRKYSVERNRIASHNRSKALTGSATSLNRSCSGERNAFRTSTSNSDARKSPTRRQTSRSPRRRVSNERGKSQRSNTPPQPPKQTKTPAATEAKRSGDRGKDERAEKKGTSATTTTTTTTAATNKRKVMCLSFRPAEFLYPNGEDDTADVDWDVDAVRRGNEDDDDDDTNSSRRKSAKGNKNASPDTDDYMDNWENDVNDLDLGSNNACDSSTPRAPAKPTAERSNDNAEDSGALNDTYVTRFVNPSPPMALQQQQVGELEATATPNARNAKSATRVKPVSGSVGQAHGVASKHASTPATPTAKPAAATTPTAAATKAGNKELFGMQEIYDQFIKSVEDAGVNVQSSKAHEVTPTKPQAKKQQRKVQSRKREERSSTTSSSSSSSASSSSSSSSSGADSSSSSSSSSSASSESEEESSERTRKSRRAKQRTAEVQATADRGGAKTAMTETTNVCATPPMRQPVAAASATYSPMTPPMPTKARTDSPATPVLPSTPTNVAAAAATPVKVKSDAAKDFKKLKSLEANLSRIQLMRENYDSADEISEELLKMEKLFMQEKNLILQKYAAKATAASSSSDAFTSTTEAAVTTPPPRQPPAAAAAAVAVAVTPTAPSAGQFVPSLLETVDTTSTAAADDATANRIFDSNREAIKLTISPLKLSRTPTIFEQLEGNDKATAKRAAAEDELDFTEKLLVKPAKEIAIVKPMMESKESKEYRSSQQRSRRSSPGITGGHDGERLRSPSGGGAGGSGTGAGGGGNSGYRDRSRRSGSHSRYSPQRRGRARSLSVSPLRGSGNSRRATSPHRRQGGGSGYTSRLRNTTRRSRSRSHSRQPGSGRRGDFSPPPHRRRRGVVPRKGALLRGYQRNERDSRSRSPRPHSPRSPPPTSLRRSYSRDRYSRSPLPFKPPSPPLRHSLSPVEGQRVAGGSSRRRSRSRSPRMPRSPRSPQPGRYHEDHRRGYDRRSLSPLQSTYYASDVMPGGPPPGSASAYSYYNHHLSPNRISLDARINIVLNGPHGGPETHASTPYDAYSNYSQYGSAATYMSLPPHPHPHAHSHPLAPNHSQPPPTDVAGAYYANHYVAMTGTGAVAPPPMQPHAHPPMYSNIPTISGTTGGAGGNGPAQNYYYNELNAVHPPHHAPQPMAAASPLVKELPKANSVAVQKGNVLEIVPTVSATELGATTVAGSAASADATAKAAERKPKIKRPKTPSWKDEVKNRQITAAALKLSREGDSERSILKPLDATDEHVKEEKPPKKKKVYFEDGIFPKCDSEDEDRKIIEDKVRRKLRKLKRRGLNPPCSDLLVAEKSGDRENRIDPELEKLPPPGPPFGLPPPQCPQPLYLRPPTPTPMLYFHYDSVVHSMYVSQLEKPIPPRLLNQKPLGAAASASASGAVLSPLSASTGSKKDLGTLPMHRAAPTSRSGDYSAAPKLIPTLQRHENVSASSAAVVHMLQHTHHQQQQHQQQQQQQQQLQHHHPHAHAHPHAHHPPPQYTVEAPSCSPALTKGTFHAITTAPPLSPQLAATAAASQRQSSPIGFIGMRINNLVRLPPSSLIRSVPPTVAGQAVVATMPPMVNMRHPSVYQHIPPPSASGEFTIAPPPTLPPTQSYNAYGPPPQFYNGGGGGGAAYPNGVPMRQQPPGYFVHQPPQAPSVTAVIRSPLIEVTTPASVVSPTASISTTINAANSSSATPIPAPTATNPTNETLEKAEQAPDTPEVNVTADDAQKL